MEEIYAYTTRKQTKTAFSRCSGFILLPQLTNIACKRLIFRSYIMSLVSNHNGHANETMTSHNLDNQVLGIADLFGFDKSDVSYYCTLFAHTV